MYLYFGESIKADVPLEEGISMLFWFETYDSCFRVKRFKEQYRHPDVTSAIKDKWFCFVCFEKIRQADKDLRV